MSSLKRASEISSKLRETETYLAERNQGRLYSLNDIWEENDIKDLDSLLEDIGAPVGRIGDGNMFPAIKNGLIFNYNRMTVLPTRGRNHLYYILAGVIALYLANDLINKNSEPEHLMLATLYGIGGGLIWAAANMVEHPFYKAADYIDTHVGNNRHFGDVPLHGFSEKLSH